VKTLEAVAKVFAAMDCLFGSHPAIFNMHGCDLAKLPTHLLHYKKLATIQTPVAFCGRQSFPLAEEHIATDILEQKRSFQLYLDFIEPAETVTLVDFEKLDFLPLLGFRQLIEVVHKDPFPEKVGKGLNGPLL
jgi:hypothetical protein